MFVYSNLKMLQTHINNVKQDLFTVVLKAFFRVNQKVFVIFYFTLISIHLTKRFCYVFCRHFINYHRFFAVPAKQQTCSSLHLFQLNNRNNGGNFTHINEFVKNNYHKRLFTYTPLFLFEIFHRRSLLTW